MSTKKGIVILEKGSDEAKEYMARLRAMRKPKEPKKAAEVTQLNNAGEKLKSKSKPV